jgi:hypothetical protein
MPVKPMLVMIFYFAKDITVHGFTGQAVGGNFREQRLTF